MWIQAGVVNTKWIEDPARVFDAMSQDLIVATRTSELQGAIVQLRPLYLAVVKRTLAGPFPAPNEQEYFYMALPSTIQITLAKNTRLDLAVKRAIREVPVRWQLDVASAAVDHLWNVDDSRKSAQS